MSDKIKQIDKELNILYLQLNSGNYNNKFALENNITSLQYCKQKEVDYNKWKQSVKK